MTQIHFAVVGLKLLGVYFFVLGIRDVVLQLTQLLGIALNSSLDVESSTMLLVNLLWSLVLPAVGIALVRGAQWGAEKLFPPQVQV